MFGVVRRELNGRLGIWMRWPMEKMGVLGERRERSESSVDGSPGEGGYVGSEVSGTSPF